MSSERIRAIEKQMLELKGELDGLRKNAAPVEVADYSFTTITGPVSLGELFAGRDKLLAIHNMGQGCRYCTLWADGINAFLPHLESAMSVVLLSKDPPELQRRFAGSRGWRFRTASHGGGKYIQEQSVCEEDGNAPGAVVYERDGDRILKRSSTEFGPGDNYCTMWDFLGLAGVSAADWTPQYRYWTRPETMDDGGQNIVD